MMSSLTGIAVLRAAALAALLVSASTAAAQENTQADAEEASEGVHQGLFATGVLDGIESGDSIVFQHHRAVEPNTPLLPDIAGTAEVTVAPAEGGGRQAQVSLLADGRARPVPPLPAEAGHPLLLIFLESAVRTVAEATGGSPFYIRRRIRETLWTGGDGEPIEVQYDGKAVDAEELIYRPFAEDPNRARMGGFADLELRFVLSEAVPGRIAMLELQAPSAGGAPQVTETLRLEGLEKEERS